MPNGDPKPVADETETYMANQMPAPFKGRTSEQIAAESGLTKEHVAEILRLAGFDVTYVVSPGSEADAAGAEG